MGVRNQITWEMRSFCSEEARATVALVGIEQWSGRVLASVFGNAKTQSFCMYQARGIPITCVNGEIHRYNMAWNVACFVEEPMTR